jgi:malonyl-CoA/methylmalonyl-CoA synthetase
VGPPLAGIDIRVVDARDLPVAAGAIGAIQVRGPNVFRGYWNLPEKTTEEFTADGFFRTGDQGRLGDDGYLTILGRDKDMIITGGLNVYPKEIEQAIDRLDGIVESAVVGVPHADFGEAVVAVVVPESGSPVTAAGIIEQLRGQLADFKLPKKALFVGELPRNAMGKVEKNELRQRYADILS